MPRGQTVPVTPEVLDWVIQTSGHTGQEIADRLGVTDQTIAAWLSGSQKPTLTSLRRHSIRLAREGNPPVHA